MKKLIIMAITVLVTFVLASTSFAAIPAPAPGNSNGNGFGSATGYLGCYGLMWNEDGSFASKDVFSARLDKAIEDNLLLPEDKEAYLERYDLCIERMANGSCWRVTGGGYGCGRGRGMRWLE